MAADPAANAANAIMKRAVIIAVNVLLGLLIAAIILATWMPAIYTSTWFRKMFPKL